MAGQRITDEGALIRLALDLGAERFGGPLSADERRAVESVANTASFQPSYVEQIRAEICAGDDPLGTAFTRLRSPLTRRAIGAFYTPSEIVEAMVAYALIAKPGRLIDPGSGSGRFTAAAARRDPALEIVAIDLDPLAALMTRGTLSALGHTNARVLCSDYLRVVLPKSDAKTAWVGNPPYVRHHDLSPATKAWSTKAAKKAGHAVSSLSGLHALFFVATAMKAKPGDVGCYITSSEWLDVGYGQIVRHLLTNGLGGRALDLVDPRAVPFADAMTTALITCFEVGADNQAMTLRQVREPAELERLAEGRTVPMSRLMEEERWSPLFREDADLLVVGNGTAKLVEVKTQPLREVVRVHRGFVSGANDFFILTREQAAEHGITEWCRPAITAATEILEADGLILDTPERRLVLDLPKDLDRKAHPKVDAYLRLGEKAGVDRGYIATHRKPWFRVGTGKPAPIVASYMARQAPRFALNPDRLALLNIGHGLHPLEPMTENELKTLVATLNAGRLGFTGTGRTYHGGLEKFEPREMEALPLPAGWRLEPVPV